jgi:hypothetical protein
MADLFSVTAPLLIRTPDGRQHVIAERFRHPNGLVWFGLFWHLGDPAETVHLIEGPLKGEGPWKVGDHVIRVLGCHMTDPSLAHDYDLWRHYLTNQSETYPTRPFIEAIARRLGATV